MAIVRPFTDKVPPTATPTAAHARIPTVAPQPPTLMWFFARIPREVPVIIAILTEMHSLAWIGHSAAIK